MKAIKKKQRGMNPANVGHRAVPRIGAISGLDPVTMVFAIKLPGVAQQATDQALVIMSESNPSEILDSIHDRIERIE
jgi:hypothetical protein